MTLLWYTALGPVNALTNQEAKIVLKQFIDGNKKTYVNYQVPPLTAKAASYLDKVEEKTDVAHSDSVQRLREYVLWPGMLAISVV